MTKKPTFKVLTSLKKIVKSEDWNIDYSKSEKPKKIKDGEGLEDYAESNFPFFKSVENWGYTIGFKSFLSDPNGLIVVSKKIIVAIKPHHILFLKSIIL